MKYSLIVVACLTLFSALFVPVATLSAAQEAADQDGFLPIGLTEEEKGRMHEIGLYHKSTMAPSGEVRNPAEWEPSEGVIIRWPLGISVDLVAEMSEDLIVTTIVEDTYDQNQAISSYTSGGVNMDNCEWLFGATNSIWTRDYGPWFIFEDEQLAIVDHVYNRPRPLDDVIPQTLGTAWGIPVYGMDLYTTGGNHMSDGLGTSISTELVWEENPSLTEAEIDSIMYAHLGNHYTVLDYIEYGGIHHIDCWAKFLNPTTILVKDVSASDYRKANLDARADWLAQQTSAWGQPYTIVRIYCPSGTAYTNSIILNDKVLVPMFSSSYDSIALQTYRDAMPGYEVLGFTGSFLDDDAIHCRTMGVPDREMLFINHIPLAGEAGTTTEDYYIGCYVSPFSGEDLIADSLKVYYRADGGAWDFVTMAEAAPDSFYAYIPAQAADAEVEYYIQAADLSGRVETHPFIGAPWAHSFTVVGPHAPSAVQPLNPVDSGGWPVFDMLPTLTWTESVDPDPNDTVYYRVEISDDSLFTAPSVVDSLLSVTCPVTDSLAPGQQYWWRVTAYDSDGLTSDVSEAAMFWTWTLGDMDHNHEVSLADLTLLIDHLFVSFQPLVPAKTGDLNGDCSVSLGDLTKMIDHLFVSFAPITAIGCE